MLLTNSRHPSSVPAHLTSVVLGSSSHEAAVGGVIRLFSGVGSPSPCGLELFTIHWCCAVLLADMFN